MTEAQGRTAARSDGRKHDELRQVSIIYEGLDRVDGSARFAFGQTSALASLSGPIEVRAQSELPSEATFDVLLRPVSNLPGTESKALAAAIRTLMTPSIILAQNPRTLVQLVIQSLTPTINTRGFHPSLVASFVNAATLAFISAGSVPMRAVVCAVSVGRLSSPISGAPALILDPSELEQSTLEAAGCFAYMFGVTAESTSDSATLDAQHGRLVWTNYQLLVPGSPNRSVSAVNELEIKIASALARRGAQRIWNLIKESLGDMEGPRRYFDVKPAGQGEDTKKVAAAAATTVVDEDGEMEDEMEEINDTDDARMEI